MLRSKGSRPVSLDVKPPSWAQNHIFITVRHLRFLNAGRPLWREDGSVIYNCCWSSLAQYFRVRVPLDSWPYFTVSDSRLLEPGGPGARIYIPQRQGGPVITPGTGIPFHGPLPFARLQCRYSTPPPSGHPQKVKVMSRPTVSRPVCLAIKHLCGPLI
jgi:hypothetical protein